MEPCVSDVSSQKFLHVIIVGKPENLHSHTRTKGRSYSTWYLQGWASRRGCTLLEVDYTLAGNPLHKIPIELYYSFA
jgi:hypothetical protein